MNKEQCIKEIETLWFLNKDTTIQDIEDYYFDITGLHNLSTGAKLNYLYKYIIDSMYRDDDITDSVAEELYKYYKLGEYSDE